MGRLRCRLLLYCLLKAQRQSEAGVPLRHLHAAFQTLLDVGLASLTAPSGRQEEAIASKRIRIELEDVKTMLDSVSRRPSRRRSGSLGSISWPHFSWPLVRRARRSSSECTSSACIYTSPEFKFRTLCGRIKSVAGVLWGRSFKLPLESTPL